MKRTGKRVFWGVFFLLAAVLIIVSQIFPFNPIGFWPIVATVFLIALFIDSLTKFNTWGILLPISVLYWLYQDFFGFFVLPLWVLLISALVASLGIDLIFGKKTRHKKQYKIKHEQCGNDDFDQPHVENRNFDTDIYESASFSYTTRYLHSEDFQNGYFSNSFGAFELYFDDVEIENAEANIVVANKFGAITLIVPKHWNVSSNVSSTFGDVTFEGSPEIHDGSPKLNIDGTNSFGSVIVNYRHVIGTQ